MDGTHEEKIKQPDAADEHKQWQKAVHVIMVKHTSTCPHMEKQNTAASGKKEQDEHKQWQNNDVPQKYREDRESAETDDPRPVILPSIFPALQQECRTKRRYHFEIC